VVCINRNSQKISRPVAAVERQNFDILLNRH
jgi:hypothetical protein